MNNYFLVCTSTRLNSVASPGKNKNRQRNKNIHWSICATSYIALSGDVWVEAMAFPMCRSGEEPFYKLVSFLKPHTKRTHSLLEPFHRTNSDILFSGLLYGSKRGFYLSLNVPIEFHTCMWNIQDAKFFTNDTNTRASRAWVGLVTKVRSNIVQHICVKLRARVPHPVRGIILNTF